MISNYLGRQFLSDDLQFLYNFQLSPAHHVHLRTFFEGDSDLGMTYIGTYLLFYLPNAPHGHSLPSYHNSRQYR